MKKKVDALGRVGIPKTVRQAMGLRENDSVWLEYDREKQVLLMKKAEKSCAVCGSREELLTLHGEIYLCKNCFCRFKAVDE